MSTPIKIATQTVTVNAAFLEEIKEVNLELWQLLRDSRRYLSDASLLPVNPHRLLGLLVHLQDNVAMHFAMEEFYGYFDDPLSVEPRLAMEAACLRGEHAGLYLQLSELIELVEQHVYRRTLCRILRSVRCRLNAFIDQFASHESRERQLILQVYQDDIGIGD